MNFQESNGQKEIIIFDEDGNDFKVATEWSEYLEGREIVLEVKLKKPLSIFGEGWIDDIHFAFTDFKFNKLKITEL